MGQGQRVELAGDFTHEAGTSTQPPVKSSRLGSDDRRDTMPGTPDHPYWQSIRRFYFYDPAPTLRQLKVPVLALFGELDNNILPEKNK